MRPASDRDRKDWVLLLLFLPFGIIAMLIAGQRAIQLAPYWNLHTNLGSNVDLNPANGPGGDSGIQPLRPEILTPPIWNDTFLTPTGDQPSATAPTFVVFDPSTTPSASPTPQPTNTIATQPTNPTGTVTVTATKTKKPKGTPTTTATATASPSPSVTSMPVGASATVPPQVNEGAPDASYGTLADGTYTVVTLASAVVVTNPSDTAPDLVYYERVASPSPTDCPTSQCISMDGVIVGISQNSNGNPYYQVFNWGDGVPDTNTNVDTNLPAIPPETDNATIATSDLYGTAPNQTGITIDVDNASSHPPPGSYSYVVIIAPASPPNDGNDGAEVDAVEALP